MTYIIKMPKVIEWITGNLDLKPEEFAKLQYKYMPPIIKEALLSK